MAKTLRILHTSDWHLGCLLYGQKRYAESEAFLHWLATFIKEAGVTIVLVSGDIFDSQTPSNKAQELYYSFLYAVAGCGVHHVVLIAGNHDSVSLLRAPQDLLRMLHIHVVASASDDPSDEVLALHDPDGDLELVVCAVPYLRDRDLRTAEGGESEEDKEEKLRQGLVRHFSRVIDHALTLRGDAPVPLVCMGHLFAAGGKTVEGDGVRDLYVGNLAAVSASCFPSSCSYVALGHLHVPQCVGGNAMIRYSGSPIPIGFGELDHEKSCCLLTGSPTSPSLDLSLVPIPHFQTLLSIKGDMARIQETVTALAQKKEAAWLEILYTGDDPLLDLKGRVDALVKDTNLVPLKVKNTTFFTQYLHAHEEDEGLQELTVDEVFSRCLDEYKIPAADRPSLLATYKEALQMIYEADSKKI